jgi:hypothetical protein
MHVDGSHRGIAELDLGTVMRSDDEKDALTVVKSLDLSHNELVAVRSLQPLAALAILNVSYNRITAVSGLPLGLTKLSLAHNRLTSLEGLAALPSLVDLDVSDNEITQLPPVGYTCLTALRIGKNRLATLQGIEHLAKLQQLDAGDNFICTTTDVGYIAELPSLAHLTLAGNPVCDAPHYRADVIATAGRLLQLDGIPCVVKAAEQPRSSSRQRTAQAPSKPDVSPNVSAVDRSSVDVSQSRSQPTTARGTALSRDVLREKSEKRRGELSDDLRRVEQDAATGRLLLDQERRDNVALRKKLARLEGQLTDSRRIVGDELRQMSAMRDANATLTAELAGAKQRGDKLARDLRYATQKARSEQRRAAEQIEEAHAAHDAELNELTVQLEVSTAERRQSDVVARRAAADATRARSDLLATVHEHGRPVATVLSESSAMPPMEDLSVMLRPPTTDASYDDAARRTPPRQRDAPASGVVHSAVHVPMSPGSDDATPARPQATADGFASQLKSWLLSELRQNDDTEAPVSTSVSQRQSPARTSPPAPQGHRPAAGPAASPTVQRMVPSPSGSIATQPARSAQVPRHAPVSDMWRRHEAVIDATRTVPIAHRPTPTL